MSGTNEFLPFATDPSANVQDQASYNANANRTDGFPSGEAPSAECNKAWRQAASMSAAIGQTIVDLLGEDALDNGDQARIVDQIERMIQAAGSAEVDVQQFTANGTWTKPGFGTIAMVEIIAGGGGGGGGQRAGT